MDQTINRQPGLNPTLDDLVRRLATQRAAGRAPRMLTMSAETWARLRVEAGGRRLCSEVAGGRRLDGVRVRLVARCLGVGISCDEH